MKKIVPMKIILGIDPGTTTVWYAVIQKFKKIELIDYWVVHTTPKIDTPTKILEIGHDIWELLKNYKPDIVVIEKLFFVSNITTGISVAESRWVIVYECMKHGVTILEYTPLQVKKAITGNGKATKKQMQIAIKMLLWLSEIPRPDDAADAIGMAYMGVLQYRK